MDKTNKTLLQTLMAMDTREINPKYRGRQLITLTSGQLRNLLNEDVNRSMYNCDPYYRAIVEILLKGIPLEQLLDIIKDLITVTRRLENQVVEYKLTHIEPIIKRGDSSASKSNW